MEASGRWTPPLPERFDRWGAIGLESASDELDDNAPLMLGFEPARGLQLAACGLRLAACGLRLAARGSRLAARGLRLAACGLQLAACSSQSILISIND